uniref:START domain-containing protein n=1 Tax=Kalanchoe fedtschenkoi TaxID=63787 RepID=A0A7N0TCY1_KALFE
MLSGFGMACRCREKQRKESSRLQAENKKFTAENRMLVEENERLQKQVSHLSYDNGFMRQKLRSRSATTDASCESVVTPHSQQNPTHQPRERDANSPAGLLAIAEETQAEFLSKATGIAVNWIQMVGMKPGPDSVEIVAVSRNCAGVAARACGLVSLEPMKVAEILKDTPAWFRDCRTHNVLTVLPTANGGTLELIYMQTYAPTTMASARDFWKLRFISPIEDGGLVVCERSLNASTGGSTGPSSPNFIRAEVFPSGFLIRPCEGGGSIIHIVDHLDLDPCSAPEILRPLYESSEIIAQKISFAALRHIRQIAQENCGEIKYGGGKQPAVLRTFSQRLSRGFNDAVNGLVDDGWSLLDSVEMDDVTISINMSASKFIDSQSNSAALFPAFGGGVLCAKVSMLLEDVAPAHLVRFIREHRSEWADYGIDAYWAASVRASPSAIPCSTPSALRSNQVILPLAHTIELEEFLEVVRLEGQAFCLEDVAFARDMFLLQLCSGINENEVGPCAQIVFAPIDESFADDALLLPSGFRVISLENKADEPGATRTLDLASVLEVHTTGALAAGDSGANHIKQRAVLTMAFQFTFENHLRDSVASMARQYVRSVVGAVQRVAVVLSPARLGSQMVVENSFPGSTEVITLARWITQSYKIHTGEELVRVCSQAGDSVLKLLWQFSEAVMCCSLTTNAPPVFTFANQSGLDMLETTFGSLQDIKLEKTLDEAGRKSLLAEFPKITQQGFAYLPAGNCMSSMGRPISYDQAIAWMVLDDEEVNHCLAFMFVNWSFM